VVVMERMVLLVAVAHLELLEQMVQRVLQEVEAHLAHQEQTELLVVEVRMAQQVVVEQAAHLEQMVQTD
jgi:hypothetical protein